MGIVPCPDSRKDRKGHDVLRTGDPAAGAGAWAAILFRLFFGGGSGSCPVDAELTAARQVLNVIKRAFLFDVHI